MMFTIRGAGTRRSFAGGVLAAVVFAASAAAWAQPVYPNRHNPSESCVEYVLAAAVCVVAGAIFQNWLRGGGGKKPDDKDRA